MGYDHTARHPNLLSAHREAFPGTEAENDAFKKSYTGSSENAKIGSMIGLAADGLEGMVIGNIVGSILD